MTQSPYAIKEIYVWYIRTKISTWQNTKVKSRDKWQIGKKKNVVHIQTVTSFSDIKRTQKLVHRRLTDQQKKTKNREFIEKEVHRHKI